MWDFIVAHEGLFAGFAVSLIDLAVNIFHPNPQITGVLDWILPFLRKAATPPVAS